MKKSGKIIRRMGYVRDQEGIMNRYLREAENWQRHLDHTRSFIVSSFVASDAETVAVLGSGWLLDIPLEQLRKRFKHVYLVDIYHPPQIRKKVEHMDRVELVTEDLTGGAIEKVWRFKKEKRKTATIAGLMEQFSLNPPLSHIQPDTLISVNLLNQLDIILCDYIRKELHFQQEDFPLIRRAIQTFHLDWIQQKPGCLISDILEEVEDKQGKKSSKALLYTDLPRGFRSDSWWWTFDSKGNYHPGAHTNMKVQAVEWT
jgi:hypothetical protein